MSEQFSRRDVLGGLGAGVAELLFSSRIRAAGFGALPSATDSILSLIAVDPKILRVRVTQAGKQGVASEIGLVERTWARPLEPAKNTNGIRTVEWNNCKIHVVENPLQVTITDNNGKKVQDFSFDRRTGSVRFQLGDGPLFGLGEGGHPLNRRGTTEAMRNGQHQPDLPVYGARVPIPWLMSADGWGLFFAHPAGSLDLTGERGAFQPDPTTPTRDIFLVLGTPTELMRQWAELTGYPHMPPLWSLGYMQSHRTLASRAEVMDEVKIFREKKLPCDAMIYLGTGFCPAGWNTGHNSFQFNPEIFPDPMEMIKEMHKEHFKVVVHVTSPPEDLYGSVADACESKDPSNAATYWARHVDTLKAGVDGWWPDEGDELPPASRLVRNRMYWEGTQQVIPNVRPFALHRNGYAGMQRFGWLWSGDNFSSWKTLAAQVMVGISSGLSGIPYWGTDTGGFVPTNEYTYELWVRWFQFSAFCPLFRSHGRAWKLHLPWGWNVDNPGPPEYDGQFDANTLPKPEDLHHPEVEEICRKYLDLRYQLLPYLYSAVAETHATGLPIMRALWLVYPDDPKAIAIEDAYLWGSNMLVAPVVEKGVTQRTVYLPHGAWWDYWSDTKVEGGKSVVREVNLETIPLYMKAGAILPVGPVKQYASEPSNEPLVLKVFPGADGRFSLYEDDGSSFNYERGQFSRVECRWNDGSRTLTLQPDQAGKAVSRRVFAVEIVGRTGRKTVQFDGRTQSVRF